MSQRAPLLFNPSRASFEELEKTFVGRWPQLEALEQDLLADAAGSASIRHWQLIGPRGSGKSHFTELLGRRLQQRHGWAVVRLPEEHYQVANLAELLEQIVIRLEGLKVSPFADESDSRRVEELALDRLRAWKREHARPVLVILENLGLLLERKLHSQRDHGRLREILSREPAFILLTTSTSYVAATVEHSAPFYDFFQQLSLEDFSRTEVIELVEARARWEQDESLLGRMSQVKARIDALLHFSGGNPRLVLALYSVLRNGVTDELHAQLLKLLDEVTPYYQSRLGDVSGQMSRVLAEMALADTPLTPAEIGQRLRLSTSQVTANMTRLVSERFVRPGERPDSKRRYYELTDRLFRLWMQMREGGVGRQRLSFLTEFFQRWYDRRQDELPHDAARVAHFFWREIQKEDFSRCTELLMTLDYLSSALPDDHGSLIVKELYESRLAESLMGPSTLAMLNTVLQRTEQIGPRTAIRYVLARLHHGAGRRREALSTLQSAVEEDTNASIVVWVFYLRLILELRGPSPAYNEGLQALERHAAPAALNEELSYLASILGRRDVAERHVKDFLSIIKCDECRNRALMNHALYLLQVDESERAVLAAERLPRIHDGQDVVVNFLWLCVEMARGQFVSNDSVLRELETVGNLEWLPAWVLESAAYMLCRLDSQLEGPFNPVKSIRGLGVAEACLFFVRNILELLVRAHARKDPFAQSLESWLSCMYVEPEVVSDALRTCMPHLAREPEFRPHVLEVYRFLRQTERLESDIPPYSTAVAVQDASSPEKALLALHPEMREAVSMLLGLGEQEPTPAPPGAAPARG